MLDLHVDADPDHLATTLRVRSVPTLIGCHDGTEVARRVGAGVLAWGLAALLRRAA